MSSGGTAASRTCNWLAERRRHSAPVRGRPWSAYSCRASADGVARGGYVLADSQGSPEAIIIATGSEVAIALAAREALAGEVDVRVVSMPCLEWFDEQDAEYRQAVLPLDVPVRVSVEAAIAQPWWRYLGVEGTHIGLEYFGASADAATLYQQFGVTAEAVADAVRVRAGV